jgi:hypothetical protein
MWLMKVPIRPLSTQSQARGFVVDLTALALCFRLRARRDESRAYLIATAFGGDAIPPSRFIGTETSMHS